LFEPISFASEIMGLFWARKTGARLVTTFDLGRGLVAYGGFPKERMGLFVAWQ
jgi:hypothetical protein